MLIYHQMPPRKRRGVRKQGRKGGWAQQERWMELPPLPQQLMLQVFLNFLIVTEVHAVSLKSNYFFSLILLFSFSFLLSPEDNEYRL